ncbi:MAG: hypothetical protein Q8K26_02750 [Candidatus Gracilibacteria bacterium]|nr:hypothetical protein [Candidatus Gracilibacteria bacterium]
MGKILKIHPRNIKPSQDFLKEGTVKFIFTCYSEDKKDQLPPAPVVQRSPDNGDYIAIDGHNLIAVKDYFDEECEVFVADHPEDELTENEFPGASPDGLASRNADLREKFESVVDDYKRLSEGGLDSFVRLREKYPDLFKI